MGNVRLQIVEQLKRGKEMLAMETLDMTIDVSKSLVLTNFDVCLHHDDKISEAHVVLSE